jgi:hypothetical protein
MKWNIKKSMCILLPALCLLFILGVFAPNVQAEKPNVNLRVDTPVGGVEINRPPPQPVVVVPQPPPQRIIVERSVSQPAPPPAPVQAAPSCQFSVMPGEVTVAGFLALAPAALLPFYRRNEK